VVLAGDFNTQPMEIAYSLILSDKLDPIQADLLRQSTVVHHSVDKKYDPDYVSPDYVPPELRNTSNKTPEDTDAEEATAEGGSTGKMVRNSREGLEEDGLIGLEGLKTLFDYRDLSVPSPTTVMVDPENMKTIDDEVLAKKSTRSAYGSIGHHFATEFAGNYYFDRSPEVHATNGWIIPEDPKVIAKRKEGTLEERIRRGDFEPKWTNFTPLWRCTLE
jgi:RNA exonuclease NGL2